MDVEETDETSPSSAEKDNEIESENDLEEEEALAEAVDDGNINVNSSSKNHLTISLIQQTTTDSKMKITKKKNLSKNRQHMPAYHF